MAFDLNRIPVWSALLTIFVFRVNGLDIFLDWNVSFSSTGSSPLFIDQQVITINGMFPGPLINATTNDIVHVNVFNFLDEPLLFTWNGIQQRQNSWQDGVSGTNCPIEPNTNWTYVFRMKDQIGSFFYFPSLYFQKASGGYGPIRVNNRDVIAVPFIKPEAEFDLLIGDWFSGDYKYYRKLLETEVSAYDVTPDAILMNGKGPFLGSNSTNYESFTVEKGKTYRFRISNVGSTLSFNFRIENHTMLLVETEGSYTNQITLNSLDVHVGQSYSVLVTADQNDADFYIIASPKLLDSTSIVGVGILHYSNSTSPAGGAQPSGPDAFDLDFSVNQAKSIRWNLTTGAARPNPQGAFNVSNITLSQTFILQSSRAEINGEPRLVVNNVSYYTPDTPLKLADHLTNGSGVYELDQFPVQSVNDEASYGTSVVSGNHKGWIELVFKNNMDDVDSWHLDGFSFFVVGFGDGDWTPDSRNSYNIIDPVARSTAQVYPRGWTAVYAFLDNPGMWNLRSQNLKNWYLGLQLYIRVFDSDPNPAKERAPPQNLLLCEPPQPPIPVVVMAVSDDFPRLIFISASIFKLLITIVNGADIFLEWDVATNTSVHPFPVEQPVITINGMFPGPLINATTNDVIHVNVFNNIDEPLLFTWNGIQQRLNSWQDGVSGTNCPIQPGKNWTYVFQVKDQIGSFIYFPSINFLKAGGGFGSIRVNNRAVIKVPFPEPEADFDLLIGDWYLKSYKEIRSFLLNNSTADDRSPDRILMNGKGSYLDTDSKAYESFNVTKGKTYRFRVSNVGTAWSFNFRIQNHRMVLVETEGSYVNQMALDSLDVHVGQSYSVLVTADQQEQDYYIVAAPKQTHAPGFSNLIGVSVLHYDNSIIPATGVLPPGPDPFDIQFSIDQAKSIRWNLTAGAARPNPQGSFNVSNVTLSQSFVLRSSVAEINGEPRYTVNNVSYLTPQTPLKLADAYANGGDGVYELDKFSTNSSNFEAVNGVFVASGIHKGWIELVFNNDLDLIHSWHLDGFGFFVVGFGDEQWTPNSRSSYNTYDPVVRSTIQVYPGRWTAVYAYLDNPGMWNLRSQHLKNWYLGQELYLRVYDPDPNPAKEKKPPENIILCGIFGPPAPPPAPMAPTNSGSSSERKTWFHIIVICIVTIACITRQ